MIFVFFFFEKPYNVHFIRYFSVFYYGFLISGQRHEDICDLQQSR